MGRYNLLDEAWIPVLRKDTGKVDEVSLLTLFSQAQEYYALAGEMETQNFAVLRVLLAILTTVFSRVDAEGEPYDCLILDETKGKRLILKEPVDEVDAEEYSDLPLVFRAAHVTLAEFLKPEPNPLTGQNGLFQFFFQNAGVQGFFPGFQFV